jgi:hypothetical protein
MKKEVTLTMTQKQISRYHVIMDSLEGKLTCKRQAFFSRTRKGEFSAPRKGVFFEGRKEEFTGIWKGVFSNGWKGEFSLSE